MTERTHQTHFLVAVKLVLNLLEALYPVFLPSSELPGTQAHACRSAPQMGAPHPGCRASLMSSCQLSNPLLIFHLIHQEIGPIQ